MRIARPEGEACGAACTAEDERVEGFADDAHCAILGVWLRRGEVEWDGMGSGCRWLRLMMGVHVTPAGFDGVDKVTVSVLPNWVACCQRM